MRHVMSIKLKVTCSEPGCGQSIVVHQDIEDKRRDLNAAIANARWHTEYDLLVNGDLDYCWAHGQRRKETLDITPAPV